MSYRRCCHIGHAGRKAWLWRGMRSGVTNACLGGDWLGGDAQVRALFALAPWATFTAIAVTAALLARFTILVARCSK